MNSSFELQMNSSVSNVQSTPIFANISPEEGFSHRFHPSSIVPLHSFCSRYLIKTSVETRRIYASKFWKANTNFCAFSTNSQPMYFLIQQFWFSIFLIIASDPLFPAEQVSPSFRNISSSLPINFLYVSLFFFGTSWQPYSLCDLCIFQNYFTHLLGDDSQTEQLDARKGLKILGKFNI